MDFSPTVYLKDGCPFCMKVDIFVLEAGLRGKVAVRRFASGDDREGAVRAELLPHFEKLTFPSAEVAPGEFMADSDGIVARLAADQNVEMSGLMTLRNYIEGPFSGLMNLYKENIELKKLQK